MYFDVKIMKETLLISINSSIKKVLLVFSSD